MPVIFIPIDSASELSSSFVIWDNSLYIIIEKRSKILIIRTINHILPILRFRLIAKMKESAILLVILAVFLSDVHSFAVQKFWKRNLVVDKDASSHCKFNLKNSMELYGATVEGGSKSWSPEITPKSVTKDIMAFFSSQSGDSTKDVKFQKKLLETNTKKNIDGLHIITILFQSARTRRLAKNILPVNVMIDTLKSWDKMWSERDISTFIYGIRSLECLDPIEGKLLKLAAVKVSESTALLGSRAIGNALYGLQDITSDTEGAAEICAALAGKVAQFNGDLNGQDIGIGLYGLQGMSATREEVRQLIAILAEKIENSETELDAQALSNALYGLQSMSSEYVEVRALVSVLAKKVAESNPELCAQAIGSALFGLQRLSSDSLEVRALVSALAEKVDIATFGLDAQAIGNALFGLQRMKSDSPEVRSLVQAIAIKIVLLPVEMDSKGIGAALYGMHSMSSDSAQVRALLAALAARISISKKCTLSGQGIADSLYGLYGMTTDCPELRALLAALADRIDATKGKLDSQEIGNALYGLQGMSSKMEEVRVIVGKLAEKIKRSTAVLRSQHVGRALLGLQRFTAESPEVRSLLRQLVRRLESSDRLKLTSSSISDALFGLQGFTSDISEVQELVGQLAKKIAVTSADLNSEQLGRALFGLQGLSSQASIFEDSAIGIDSDEVQFLLSALWDKVKVRKEGMTLASIGMGLQGIILLKDPIANNLRQYMYLQLLKLGAESEVGDESNNAIFNAEDVISVVRSLRISEIAIPPWLLNQYDQIESLQRGSVSGSGSPEGSIKPVFPLSKADKLVAQRYRFLHPDDGFLSNTVLDGFRLDMDFLELKLNIELDGPTHSYPAKARYDKLRDEYLTAKKGYTVARILLANKKVDEIIKEIDETVNRRKDFFVQKLYSPDAAIRRIYSPRRNG